MRILLTGASGFLGKAALAALRRASPSSTVVPVSRVRPAEGGALLCDLSDPEQVSTLPSVDAIVHLAAYVPAVEAEAGADASLSGNARATLNLLEFAAARKIGNFVLGSSCALYGAQEHDEPVSETHPPRPDNFYALSKLSAETLSVPYEFVYGMRIKALRFSYVYGPGMRESTVIRIFEKQARSGQMIRVFNGGQDFFDLLHVEDAAAAVCAALKSDANGVFNIGSGVATTTRRLAETVVQAVGSGSRIEVLPAAAPRRGIRLAIAAAERGLGWQPRIGLLDGLGRLAPFA